MENLCVFYTSKYHLGIILMQYLKNKNINKFLVKYDFENKIEKEISVLKKNYFKENKIVLEDMNKSKNTIESNTIFIIEGNIQQIEEKSEKIKNIAKKNNCKNIEIIKCFNFYKYSNSMDVITQKNKSILMTFGKKVID